MENIAVNNVLITIHLTSVSFNDLIFVNRYAPANTALLWTFPCISPCYNRTDGGTVVTSGGGPGFSTVTFSIFKVKN